MLKHILCLVVAVSATVGIASTSRAGETDKGESEKRAPTKHNQDFLRKESEGSELSDSQRQRILENTYGGEFMVILQDVAAGLKHEAHVGFRWDEKQGRVVAYWDPYRHDAEIGAGKMKPIELTDLQRRHILERTYGNQFAEIADAVATGTLHPRQVRFRWDETQGQGVTVGESRDNGSGPKLTVQLYDGRIVTLDSTNPEHADFIDYFANAGDEPPEFPVSTASAQ
jgi:hypothetical protein